jgi:hypothetical protein
LKINLSGKAEFRDWNLISILMNKLITRPPVGGHVKQLHETNDSEVDELHVLHP